MTYVSCFSEMFYKYVKLAKFKGKTIFLHNNGFYSGVLKTGILYYIQGQKQFMQANL